MRALKEILDDAQSLVTESENVQAQHDMALAKGSDEAIGLSVKLCEIDAKMDALLEEASTLKHRGGLRIVREHCIKCQNEGTHDGECVMEGQE